MTEKENHHADESNKVKSRANHSGKGWQGGGGKAFGVLPLNPFP